MLNVDARYTDGVRCIRFKLQIQFSLIRHRVDAVLLHTFICDCIQRIDGRRQLKRQNELLCCERLQREVLSSMLRELAQSIQNMQVAAFCGVIILERETFHVTC